METSDEKKERNVEETRKVGIETFVPPADDSLRKAYQPTGSDDPPAGPINIGGGPKIDKPKKPVEKT